jgi:hypothetical protein
MQGARIRERKREREHRYSNGFGTSFQGSRILSGAWLHERLRVFGSGGRLIHGVTFRPTTASRKWREQARTFTQHHSTSALSSSLTPLLTFGGEQSADPKAVFRFRFSIFSLGHTKTCQPLQTTANFSPSGRDLSALFGSEKSSTGALALSLSA